MIGAIKKFVEGFMARRALTSPKGTLVAILLGGILLSGTSRKAAAAPTSSAPLTQDPVLLMTMFSGLTLCLVLWMLWDRMRVKRRLDEAEKQNALQALSLKSRRGVSLVWDEQGHLTSFTEVKRWFGVTDENAGLDCLRSESVGLSDQQYDALMGHITRLLDYGESFRKLLYLAATKRHIVVKGETLTVGAALEGSIVWFRDATLEENIANQKEKETKRIRSRLAFLESTSDLVRFPMWMRDPDLNLSWVNAAYVDAVDGETVDQVIAEGLELATSSIGKTVRDIAMISRDVNKNYNEKHFVVIRGERRAVDIHNIPVRREGRLMGSLGYALDITELEKAKGELIHHTESHSETLNKLSTAVAIFTSGKRLEYYNSAFSRLWQLPENLLFSHPHHGEVLEAMRDARRLPEQANFPAWKAAQMEAYTQLLEPVEEMWHLPDNTSLRVVTQPHPLGGLLIFYEDVTDHFALERSYNTLFAVQRESLNNLHEGVAVFGVDGCLQLYNQAFADIWKLPRKLLDDNPHTMDVMDACARNFGNTPQIDELNNLIVGGEVKKEISSGQIRRRDSSVLDYSAVPLPDGAMLTTFIDVSDSIAIETALRERNQALEETDKIKTDFLAHMSYELRTPLNSIIGFSELLGKEYQGPLNDVQHEYMNNILSASGQLLELINDILDLSVIEAGGLTLDVGEFTLPAVMDQIVGQMQERIKAKDIEMVVDCESDLKPVWGDAKRIHHVIYNLLSNAVKFTPSLGTVTVKVEQMDENYRIMVRDTGVGIKPDEVNKIFEKFYTGSNVPNEQGAGLGLSLVKSFVELHGGTVGVESSLNVGTTITLELPRRIGMAAQVSLVGE
tara:strand:- start:3101 stop:5641 length:2541 start_codon:yes stop_codon:yes gene_type:complete